MLFGESLREKKITQPLPPDSKIRLAERGGVALGLVVNATMSQSSSWLAFGKYLEVGEVGIYEPPSPPKSQLQLEVSL